MQKLTFHNDSLFSFCVIYIWFLVVLFFLYSVNTSTKSVGRKEGSGFTHAYNDEPVTFNPMEAYDGRRDVGSFVSCLLAYSLYTIFTISTYYHSHQSISSFSHIPLVHMFWPTFTHLYIYLSICLFVWDFWLMLMDMWFSLGRVQHESWELCLPSPKKS